jgi:hypothetical protein
VKLVGLASLLAALLLTAAGCAGGAGTTRTSASHLPKNHLPKSLRAFIHTTRAGFSDGAISEIDAYGPGSRRALVKAAYGDTLNDHAKGFYLLVFHGRFVCSDCGGLARHKPFRGTTESWVWSPKKGGLDWGFGHALPSAVSRLHRVATITAS